MVFSELVALNQLFDGYFHQGALLGGVTPAEVANEFAALEGPAVLAAARMELKQLLMLSDAEIREAVCYLGSDWDFGDETRAFLVEIQQAWSESNR